MPNERRFYSTPSSGGIWHPFESDYLSARNAATGTVVTGFSRIGQMFNPGYQDYCVYRTFPFFDTSAIPKDAIIEEATLTLDVFGNASLTDFDIVIQNGQPNYPHDPLTAGDYDLRHYGGNGGSLDTSTFRGPGLYEIPLNSEGLKWINRGGVTKLCLRSSRDIESIITPGPPDAPAEEYVDVFLGTKGETTLFVRWRVRA